ncbi:MAG: PAS domain S-box protein, partial [Nitrospinales bacterium]
LARSEKLIRSILSSAVDGIISIDEHGIVELFNPAAERMFGYRADEIIGKTVTLLMPEPYKSEHGEYMRNYLRTGKSNIIGIGIEVVGQRKNGSIFPMELAVSEVRLDDRRLFAGIARDISERKKMEEKIRQFSRAVEQSPASVMITDTHGNIEYANLKFTQVTGYSFEEVEGKNPRFLKSGEQPAEIYKVLWDTISSGKEWRGEFHNKKKNGELFWEVVSVSPIKNQDGETTHFLAVKEDITARKRTQEEIKSLSKFPSENPGPVLRLSSDGKILYANNAGRLLLKHWNREMGQAAPIDWQKNILQVLSSRSSKDVEIDIKDRTFAFQISPIPDMGYVNIYGRDITERKRAEERLKKSREQLVHAEKLSAIGKLAASMAHEFNNPIYGIRNVLEQIEERIPMNDAYKEMAGLAVRECNRVAELIWKLQDFDRPSSGIIAPMDIHEVINDMLILSQKKLKERKITLEKRYADDMPMIRGVADQIRQVVLNLIQNAEEAIPEDGGKITIRTAARDKTIEVHIQNTGRCISPENMKMIFDPFFTTKSSVKGTGLGLSVSYGIVKSHGGDIQVNSKPGRGATFIVSLPRELPNEIALHRKRV